MAENDITVVIPSIPVRPLYLQRAINSVIQQTYKAAALSIAIDVHREGAAATRQRALEAVQTPWVAFLDDDDAFKPQHLERMIAHALETGADFVYSWFEVVGGRDPFPSTHFTNDWNPADPIETTVTTLVRTGLAKQVGMREAEHEGGTNPGFNSGEDRRFTLGCMEAGAMISHLKEKTWYWYHHGANTSGLAKNW